MGRTRGRDRRRELEPETRRHPSEDTSDRFAVDALLRAHGFVIFRRTAGKPVLWVRRGKVLSQDRALEGVDQEKVWGAEYLEKLYWDGFPSAVELGAEV